MICIYSIFLVHKLFFGDFIGLFFVEQITGE